MRRKRDTQNWLEFQESNLKVTNEYFAKYEGISAWLDETPEILELVHRDTKSALLSVNQAERRRDARFRHTSEQALRLCICQVVEGQSLRGITVRVDDSRYLRSFTRIFDGPMMDFTTLDRLRNAIHPETWQEVNRALARAAVRQEAISGDELRLDTTAVETNIHWPTDSSMLWDIYRTFGRLIGEAREIDPDSVGIRRVHLSRVKSLRTKIVRRAQTKGRKAADFKTLYEKLIRHVEGICSWAAELVPQLERGLDSNRYGPLEQLKVESLVVELRHFKKLSARVVWQATERIIEGRPVSNEEKLFSIFESHTELLKRGKAGKDIEFGHMIQIQQVGSKFITDYEVFGKKPIEPALLQPALASHEELFGRMPDELTADKGYWSSEEYAEACSKVKLVAIAKKGRRNSAEDEREADPSFRLAQAFRAGVEGSISFLKRCLGLARCMNKGWRNYVSTVGITILAHNLLVLARC